ncbi:hypothetical protein K474DRAFT_1560594, partial [Panus rudis PR-1116 ss-1]
MPKALISVSQMVKGNHPIHFERDGCRILTPERSKYITIREVNGLYPIYGKIASTPSALVANEMKMSLADLHRLTAHANPKALLSMVSKGIIGGVVLTDTSMPFCATCPQAKQTRTPFPPTRSSPQAKHYGDRVHTDVWGKASVKSLRGKEYYVTFLDD